VKGTTPSGGVTVQRVLVLSPARNGSWKNLIKADYAVGAPQTQGRRQHRQSGESSWPKSLFYLRLLRKKREDCVSQTEAERSMGKKIIKEMT